MALQSLIGQFLQTPLGQWIFEILLSVMSHLPPWLVDLLNRIFGVF